MWSKSIVTFVTLSMKMKLSDLLEKKQFQKITPKRKVAQWQDLAASICKEFEIQPRYRSMIFKLAKNNKAYLEAKAGLMREINPITYKQLKENGKLGNYLFSLFRKNKP